MKCPQSVRPKRWSLSSYRYKKNESLFDGVEVKLPGVLEEFLALAGVRNQPRHVKRPGHPCFFSSRRRHTISVSAFLLNRSSDLFAASWLLNALLRIFAMSIITPKRKVLRMSVQDCWRPPL